MAAPEGFRVTVRFLGEPEYSIWVDGGSRKRNNWNMNTEDLRRAALPACRKFDVRRLDLFGSTARDATSAASDVDLLVEFKDPDRSSARRFFGLLHYLEDTLGCEVDLLTTTSLRNPYFRKRVLKERIPIYEG